MVNGFKVNFKPTPNFEFGVGRTGFLAGPISRSPLGRSEHSLFSTSNASGRGKDPGDRRSTFDFSYRIPGFSDLLTLYDDSFVEDEISPIGYPRRSAHNPGIYLSQFPASHTWTCVWKAPIPICPGLIQTPQGGFFYWNTRYLDGYTNKGQHPGKRHRRPAGNCLRAQTTYWFLRTKPFSSAIAVRLRTACSFRAETCETLFQIRMELQPEGLAFQLPAV